MTDFKKDTYFFSSEAALIIAKQRNRVKTSEPYGTGLQICYYDGAPLSNAPENCIHLPSSDLYPYLVTTKNRLPSFIDFSLTNFSEEIQASVLNSLQEIFNAVHNERNKLVQILYPARKGLQPNFNNGLRFFLLASRETQVLQHVSMNITNTLTKMGYPVFISTEENEMQQLHQYHYAKDFLEFKPNVVINIDHFNNAYLHDDIFNFVWFQDEMPVLLNDEPLFTRERDFVFYLVDHLKDLLEKKNLRSEYQPFCINTDIYKKREDIQREKKIVFIGSSYKFRLTDDVLDSQLLDILIPIFNQYGRVENEKVIEIAKQFGIPSGTVYHALGYIVRDVLVLQLCRLKIPYQIEIYGFGWEGYQEIKPFYKGILNYGEDISKVYNSATYAFVPAEYLLQQRTLEAAASGAIPIAYDSRFLYPNDNEHFTHSVIYFQKIEELEKLLIKDALINKDLNPLIRNYTYEIFVQKLIDIIETNQHK